MMRRARHLLATAPQSCCDEQVAAKVLYCPSIERRTVRNFFKVGPQLPAASRSPAAVAARTVGAAGDARVGPAANVDKHREASARPDSWHTWTTHVVSPQPRIDSPCLRHRVCMCAGGGPPQARGAPQHRGAPWRSVLATHLRCLRVRGEVMGFIIIRAD
eukprot:COSAG01_NODE_66_length_29241_cov_17.772768_5_plen_160_part_00